MKPVAAAVLSLSACASLGGCATAALGAAASVGVYAAQERTIGQGFDDARASAEVKARLLSLDANAFSRVDVEVAQGRVLLTGAAPSLEHRLAAEQAVWRVDGVEAVANEIEVGPRAGLVRSALDQSLTARVRARLVAAKDARAIDVNIETFRGVVYLMGLVGSPAAQARVEDIASRTPGVVRVVSYLEARPAPPLTHAGADRYNFGVQSAEAGQETSAPAW